MDLDTDSHWWVMGLIVGTLIILAFIVVESREEILDLRVVNESLRVRVLAAESKEQAWTCSRISADAKRGGLVKWCVSKSGA